MAIYKSEGEVLMNELVTLFYQREETFLYGMLDNLLKDNKSLGGTELAFRYGSAVYSTVPLKHYRGQSILPVHESLEERAHSYAKELAAFEAGCRQVKRVLSIAVRYCKTRQDIRNVLPETLVKLCNSLKSLPRTEAEGYTLAGAENALLYSQFKEAAGILLDFDVKRLMT